MSVDITIEQPPMTKERRGCWFYGCLTGLVLFLLVSAGIVGGLWWLKDHGGTTVVKAEYSPELAQQARLKMNAFAQQIAATKDPVTFTLTEQELNALIANDPEFNRSGARAEVKFEEDAATGRISLPFHNIYLNGMASLDVFTRDGRLFVHLTALEIKGFRVPEFMMREIRKTNLADPSTDPGHTRGIDKLDITSVTLTRGQITLTAVAQTPPNAPTP